MRARTKAIALTVILLVLIVVLAVVIALRATVEASRIPGLEATEPAGERATPLDVIVPIPPETRATGPAQPKTEAQEPQDEADANAPDQVPEPAPVRNERYAAIEISEAEIEELAQVTFAEAGNQSAEGQQAVVEVILNRVLHPAFPDTVHDVLHQDEHTKVPQFSTVYSIGRVEPNAMQYAAIEAALYGTPILDTDVVFFSTGGENDRVWGQIGAHVFCREYIWG